MSTNPMLTSSLDSVIPNSPLARDEDAQLLKRAQMGETDAFQLLVARHEKKIFRIILRITGHHEDAEDVMQETLLRAFTRLHQFEGNARFGTWFVSIGINEALGRLRKRRKNLVSIDQALDRNGEMVSINLIEPGLNPEQRYRNQQLSQHLIQGINSLPSSLKAVFEKRYVEQLSTEEAAQSLGLTVIALKSRALRARRKLRQHFEAAPKHRSTEITAPHAAA